MAQKSQSSLDPDVPLVRLPRSSFLLRAPGVPMAGGCSAAFLTHCLDHPSLFSLLNYVTGPPPMAHQSEDNNNGESRRSPQQPHGGGAGGAPLAKMIRRPFSRRSNLVIDPSMPPPSAWTTTPPPLPEFSATTCPLSLPSNITRTVEAPSPTGRQCSNSSSGGGARQPAAWGSGGGDEVDTEMLGCDEEEPQQQRGGEAQSARMLGCDWAWRGRNSTTTESLRQKHARWTRLLEEGCDMERMQRWMDRMEERRLDRECMRYVVREITSSSTDGTSVSPPYAAATYGVANSV
eukprot:GHVS01063308.1.p1 GENE.GHVS01063308.1~~GHVS01063308.1.p1  ORF type:complete len:336 (-),score=81.23 GHVS01063308.1:137-1009(-)